MSLIDEIQHGNVGGAITLMNTGMWCRDVQRCEGKRENEDWLWRCEKGRFLSVNGGPEEVNGVEKREDEN